ncbi:uncharacterized protein MKK02DRAFT_37508 [Dioszegia hungarica]|uniref:Uncharacterized protein n=1 Tax=Dioszegia hungarica TaxID=4972 RepID=A0AA38H643_9TREE|nr:uncharacterized protein MKK02DRAFT_37508 [Dioszegia hungarica]KAI9634628.1 hypothetical protein MKK02DRAFT_37508 [Dioszegia hungarica]
MSSPNEPDDYTTNRTFYEAVEIAKICAAITHILTGGDATSLDLRGLWNIPVTNWSEDTRSQLLLPGLTGSSPEQLRRRLDGLITYLRFGPEAPVPTEMSYHPATVEHHAHLLWKALEDEGLFALMQQDQSVKVRICMEAASDITKCLVDDSDTTTDGLKVLAGSIQIRGSELQATHREYIRRAYISSLGDLLIPDRAASWDPALSWGFRREELDGVPPSENDWTLRYCLSELFEPVANEPALTLAELRSRLYASLTPLLVPTDQVTSYPSEPLFLTYTKVELAKHLARSGALSHAPREVWKTICEQYAPDIVASRIPFAHALQDAGDLTRSAHAEHSFTQENHLLKRCADLTHTYMPYDDACTLARLWGFDEKDQCLQPCMKDLLVPSKQRSSSFNPDTLHTLLLISLSELLEEMSNGESGHTNLDASAFGLHDALTEITALVEIARATEGESRSLCRYSTAGDYMRSVSKIARDVFGTGTSGIVPDGVPDVFRIKALPKIVCRPADVSVLKEDIKELQRTVLAHKFARMLPQ